MRPVEAQDTQGEQVFVYDPPVPTLTRTIGGPRRAAVCCDADGIPVAVAGRPVECVRDEWRVDEAWWTARPVHRHYFELVLRGGTDVVVFVDRRTGEWWAQRA